MSTVDLHQHLWPTAFQQMLRGRAEPPLLRGDELVTVEGTYPFTASDHDPEQRLRDLDRDGIDVAVLSLQTSLGLEDASAAERDELELAWLDGIAGVVDGAPGRFRALAPSRVAPGCPGTSLGACALTELERHADLLTEVERSGGFVFVHPEAFPGQSGAPEDWWGPVVDYGAQMQKAYFSWLAGGRERFPTLRVVFAILAGGAPFQLERRAVRGDEADVRSALDPLVFFDVSSYGRRAIELCIETFGVHQLVYGSDTPVADPGPTLLAVRGFGDSVAQLMQVTTPGSLLA
jgi:hypothetical protein